MTADILRNAVFIHIRMGDYMNHFMHYIQYKTYLNNAIATVLNKYPETVLYICSNETNKANILTELGISLSPKKYIFDIDINPSLNPLKTLQNMSFCTHGGICYNSSFSWIGAYLSRLNYIHNHNNIHNTIKNNMQIFIMPNKWFNDVEYEHYKDIYPEWSSLIILDT